MWCGQCKHCAARGEQLQRACIGHPECALLTFQPLTTSTLPFTRPLPRRRPGAAAAVSLPRPATRRGSGCIHAGRPVSWHTHLLSLSRSAICNLLCAAKAGRLPRSQPPSHCQACLTRPSSGLARPPQHRPPASCFPAQKPALLHLPHPPAVAHCCVDRPAEARSAPCHSFRPPAPLVQTPHPIPSLPPFKRHALPLLLHSPLPHRTAAHCPVQACGPTPPALFNRPAGAPAAHCSADSPPPVPLLLPPP